MNKIHNNLTIENLIKTEYFKQLDRLEKQEIVMNSEWFNQFDSYQKKEIRKGLIENLDISIYAKKELHFSQMREIRERLLKEKLGSSYSPFLL